MKISTLTAALASAALFSCASGAQAPPVEAYAGLPDVGDVAISPDGSRLVMLRPVEGRHAVVVYGVENLTTPQRVGSVGDELRMGGVRWASDRYILANVYGTGTFSTPSGLSAGGVSRLFSLDADTGEAQMLGRNIPGANAAHVESYLPGDEDHVLMSVRFLYEASRGTIDRLPTNEGSAFVTYHVNLSNGRGRQTHMNADSTYTVDIEYSPDGEPVARLDHVRDRDRYELRRAGGGWPVVQSWDDVTERPVNMIGAARNGASVVLASNFGTDNYQLRALDLASGQQTPFASAPAGHDISGFMRDIYSAEIVAFYYVDDHLRQRFLDEELERWRSAIEGALGGDPTRIVSWSRDRTRYVVRVEGDQDAGSYHLFDTNTMALSPIGFAYPAIPVEQIATTRRVDFTARDGRRIPAYLTVPAGARGSQPGLPMVVLPHGGPEARDSADFDWLTQLIASRGYAVLRPNFRGSAGFGVNFRDAGHGEWGGAMIDDVADGVSAMIAQNIADPDRICAVGWSYGGYAALSLATRQDPALQCVVSINGVTDLDMIMADARRSEDYANSEFMNYVRSYIGERSSEDLRAWSPRWNVHHIDEPALVIQAENDTVVPVEHARAIQTTAGSRNLELVLIPGDDHSMNNSETRTQVARRLTSFLAQHLN